MSLFGVKIYTVHVKPGAAKAYENAVFVREGFNPWAFLLPLPWALYRRLWLASIILFLFTAALMFVARNHVLAHGDVMALDLAFHLLVGFSANDWVRARLTRRGYILADISASDSRLRAKQRYFERSLNPAAHA